MRRRWLRTAALILAATMLAGCSKNPNEGKYALPYVQQQGDEFNESLYYRNDLKTVACDPSILWVSQEQDPDYGGYFYLYPSSDMELSYKGVAVYRSKNMSDWEYLEPAFYPTTDSYWATLGIMAPETVYDAETGKYYMFFSGAEDRQQYFNCKADQEEYYRIQAEVDGYDVSEIERQLGEFQSLMPKEGEETAAPKTLGEITYTENQLAVIVETLTGLEAGLKDQKDEEQILAQKKAALTACRQAHIGFKTYTSSRYALGVAVSDNPVGPFVEYTNDPDDKGYDAAKRTIRMGQPFIQHEDFAEGGADLGGRVEDGGKLIIGMDVSPFEDPKDHKKYIYFSNPYIRQEYIYVVEIGDHWTDDPKWDTLTAVSRHGYTTVDGTESTDYVVQTALDEAPHAYYDAESDHYYLAITFDGAWNKTYAVAQAVGKSPMGPFTKVQSVDGGLIVSSNMQWDHVSGPGHCCFVKYDDKLYISYQGIFNRLAMTGELYSSNRAISVDEVKFIENTKGEKVMYTNGPSVAVMPKIGPDAEYSNIAGPAQVKVSGGDNEEALNDGLITYTLYHDIVPEFNVQEGAAEITLSFDDYRPIRSIMIFNSKNMDTMFEKIQRIELDFVKTDESGKEVAGTAYMEDLVFDTERFTTQWDGSDSGIDQMARPGGSVAVEFEELKVKDIRITIESEKPVSVSEIFVLGK